MGGEFQSFPLFLSIFLTDDPFLTLLEDQIHAFQLYHVRIVLKAELVRRAILLWRTRIDEAINEIKGSQIDPTGEVAREFRPVR
jgi:hypothetical protein